MVWLMVSTRLQTKLTVQQQIECWYVVACIAVFLLAGKAVRVDDHSCTCRLCAYDSSSLIKRPSPYLPPVTSICTK
uniref:Uncharacterized protein n=1 Tax=Anopheles minimus TaxID=112268 RepID=A0A182W653_9DIPT